MKTLAIVPLLALCGCISGKAQTKLSEYELFGDGYWNSKDVVLDGTSFVVAPHPTQKSLMIRISNGDAFGNALTANVTLGQVNNNPDYTRNKAAAAKFLTENPLLFPNCVVDEAYLVEPPHYEVFLNCPDET